MLKIGTVVDGTYKILNIVGKGGMSTVYLAMNEKVNKQWAIKEIPKHTGIDCGMVKKEIELMKKLKHPNLPAIVDVIEQRDSLLIVMDYIEGRTLEHVLLEEGELSEQQVINLTKQLCRVLDYLHNQTPPIIYRDMKPSNVMLKPDGTVMLIDFGAAREFDPEQIKDTVLLGTRGYAAPEQYKKEGQSDARTDIYSIGVTMFRLLTGRLPQELKTLEEAKPEVSPGLAYIVSKCTEVEKEKRYTSAKELLFALEHYWEYDKQFRKTQQKKLLFCMIPACLTFAFAVAAMICGGISYQIRNNNYQAFLEKAENSKEFFEAAEYYKKAIRLKPGEETAYVQLLCETLLEDEVLREEESLFLREILLSTDENGVTNEEALRKNKEGAAQFFYEAGIVYFYKYEDRGNKKYAASYFAEASKSETLPETRRRRAERLAIISDYYAKLGLIDEAGDVLVSYKDYWEDLLEASSGNLAEEDNERTALVMYEEIVSQVISKAAQLLDAGVSQAEILVKLQDIRGHLERDFTDMNAQKEAIYIEEIELLKKQIQTAVRFLESIAGKEG